jgi:diadenosine tetraphosphate (Ap4A) HIT family hydrolase
VAQVRDDARQGKCFVCSIVAGERDDHAVIVRDEVCIAFLSRFPTLYGTALLAPVEHRGNVVTDFTEHEYVELQRRMHRLGVALAAVVPTERLYVLSLGSHQGNSHVHWHLAPLPPGVAYEDQQYTALMHEYGYLDVPYDEQMELARRVAGQLQLRFRGDPVQISARHGQGSPEGIRQ